jgi:hypothetical protein
MEWEVIGKSCCNCGKSIPTSIGVGDRCPHCGVTFGEERSSYSSASSSSNDLELPKGVLGWLGTSVGCLLSLAIWIGFGALCIAPYPSKTGGQRGDSRSHVPPRTNSASDRAGTPTEPSPDKKDEEPATGISSHREETNGVTDEFHFGESPPAGMAELGPWDNTTNIACLLQSSELVSAEQLKLLFASYRLAIKASYPNDNEYAPDSVPDGVRLDLFVSSRDSHGGLVDSEVLKNLVGNPARISEYEELGGKTRFQRWEYTSGFSVIVEFDQFYGVSVDERLMRSGGFCKALQEAMIARGLEPHRFWTDSSGVHNVEAELVGFQEHNVLLKRIDGFVITVPYERLAEADQEWVRLADRLGRMDQESPGVISP